MGYIPAMPPPPPNQRGDDVGASIPPMVEMLNRGRMDASETRRLERMLCDDQFRCRGQAPFWTSGIITVGILSLCLFSFGFGMWVGQIEGMRMAKLTAEMEKTP